MIRFVLSLIIFLNLSTVYAANQAEVETNVSSALLEAKKTDAGQQLQDLAILLTMTRKDAADILSQFNSTKDAAEKKRIQIDLDKVNAQIDDLMASIEKISAGALERDLFSEQQNKGFDWKQEIEDVFKPILTELKQMTERPRKIEQLRSEQAFFEDRLPVAIRAVDKLTEMKQQNISPELKKELTKIEDRWRKRRSEIENKLKISKLELEQLLAPEDAGSKDILQSVQDILMGRGLSLVLAIGLFSLSLFLMRTAHRAFDRRVSRNKKKRKVFANRVINFLFSTFSFVIALLIAMAVLSIRGDWPMLGLLILILVAAGLALRQSIPLYIKEARILLNVGSVREDERVIYNGLPWRVADLSVYSTLVNPLLKGGRLRLSLEEIATLNSRPASNEEIWFPTREEDYVLLDDATYGCVISQTPEYVQLKVASSIQTFSVQAFLGKSPRNLSIEGFRLIVLLGLDYRYQSEITTRIRDELENYMRNSVQQHPFGADLKELTVEFSEAAASSLNLAILAVFKGSGANNYSNILRLLNKLSVDACNHFGWNIPFNQISVHMETPLNSQSSFINNEIPK